MGPPCGSNTGLPEPLDSERLMSPESITLVLPPGNEVVFHSGTLWNPDVCSRTLDKPLSHVTRSRSGYMDNQQESIKVLFGTPRVNSCVFQYTFSSSSQRLKRPLERREELFE